MGFFDEPLFDFNGDGQQDEFETFVGLQMTASSRQDAIDLTGDDTFYMGSDTISDPDDGSLELEASGLDYDDLEMMDEDERRAVLEDAGFDSDDFDF